MRSLLGLVGVATVVLTLLYVTKQPGHVPLYDANLVRLAESDLQGYCAGKVLWQTGEYGDARRARGCRDDLAEQRSNEPNPAVAVRAFCQAIVDEGWDGVVSDCLGIMADGQLWPTYDGSMTDQWNRARPYPQVVFGTITTTQRDDSRTGDRPTYERNRNRR